MQKVNHFSLRKTAMYGLTSCLIGIAFMGAGRTVKADANTNTSNAPTEAVQKQNNNTASNAVKADTSNAKAPKDTAQNTKMQYKTEPSSTPQPAKSDNAKQQTPAVKADAGSNSAAPKKDNAKETTLPVKNAKPTTNREALTDKIIAGANKQVPAQDKKAESKQSPADEQMQENLQKIKDAVAPYLKEKDVWQQRFLKYYARPQATTHYYKIQFKGGWKYQTQTEADGSVKYDVMLNYYYDFGEYWDYDMHDLCYKTSNIPLFTKETGYYSNIDDLIAKINSYKQDFDNAKTYQRPTDPDRPWSGTLTSFPWENFPQYTKPSDFEDPEIYKKYGPGISCYMIEYGPDFKDPGYSIVATGMPEMDATRNSPNTRVYIGYIGKNEENKPDTTDIERVILLHKPDGTVERIQQDAIFNRTINIVHEVNIASGTQTQVYNTPWMPDTRTWPAYNASLDGYTAWKGTGKAWINNKWTKVPRTPLLNGIIPEKDNIKATDSFECIDIYYTKNTQDKKTITRTIKVENPDGSENIIPQTVTFTRTDITDINTGKSIPGKWSENGKHVFGAYTAPVIPGYTATDSVPQITVTPDSKDTIFIITYSKTPAQPTGGPTTPSQPTQVSQATQPAPVHPTVPPTQPTKPSQQIPPKAAKSPQIAKPGQSAKSGNVKPKATRGGKEGISVEPQSEKGKNGKHKILVLAQREQRAQKAEPISAQPNKQAKMLPQTGQRNNPAVAFGLAVLNLGLLILAGLGLRKRKN